MKILFLSHYFPPEVNAPATRAYEHCRQWVKEGHQVTVVTCAPNHPFGNVYEGYQNEWLVEEKDGIKIIRIKTFISANEGFVKRTASYLSYMFSSIAGFRKYGDHDIVLSTSPQFFNGLAGYFVSELKRIPWVLEVRDLWPDSILAVGAIKNKFIINLLYRIEKFAYRACDHIVVVTDSFKSHIEALGINSEKIDVIKNGVDLTFFDNNFRCDVQPDQGKYEDICASKLEGKFVASYVGTHGMAHNLEAVLKAAARLKHRDDIHFLFVGGGAEREKLLQLKTQLELNNVTMAAQKPKGLMPWIWSLTNLSLVHLKRDPLFKTVIPSKIFESMAMKKPILLGVEGESANMISRSRAGVTVEPGNDLMIAESIEYLADNQDLCRELGENGRRYVERDFNRDKLAIKYLDVLAGVLGESREDVVDQVERAPVHRVAHSQFAVEQN